MAEGCCDLYALLGGNSGNSSSMNKAFCRWHNWISWRVPRRMAGDYEKDIECGLFDFTKGHIHSYGREFDATDVLFLVHPFYANLVDVGSLEDEAVDDLDDYVSRLLSLLEYRDRSKLGVIVLDTLHHYAAASSLLLEDGLVDNVFLTDYDKGFLFDETDFLGVSGRHNYFWAGGYNGFCLEQAIYDFFENTSLDASRVYGVEELVLGCPRVGSRSLKCHGVVSGLSEEQVVSIDRLREIVA